jgi:RNA polymerase sigma-70 factor, ECF subfamily
MAVDPGQARTDVGSLLVRKADAQPLQSVYERDADAIFRFLYRYTHRREVAEDLTAEVFLKALRSLDRSREPASMRSWLFRVAWSTFADYWRGLRRHPTCSLDDVPSHEWPVADTEADGPGDEPAEEVRQILAHLPKRSREVLTRRYLLNQSVKETAAAMRLSEPNVKALTRRALAMARQWEALEAFAA